MDLPWPDGIIPPGKHDIAETILIDHPASLGLTLRGSGVGYIVGMDSIVTRNIPILKC